jgi:non-specific serine/threonine protein kinase
MVGSVAGRLVIAGGSYWDGDQKRWSDRVDFFDPHENAWHGGPALPESRSDAAAVSLGDALYIFGGGASGQTRRDALVLRDRSWKRLPGAELPAPRHYSVAVTIGKIVYLAGGLEKGSDTHTATNTLWAWNCAEPDHGWKPLPPMPGPPRMTQAVAALDGRIYIFGGAQVDGDKVTNLSDAYRFDTIAGTWTRLKDLPVARHAWWATPGAKKILLLGGYTNTFENAIFAYDPDSQTLTQAGTLPHATAGVPFVPVQGRLIGAGGEVGNHIRGEWTMEMDLPSPN